LRKLSGHTGSYEGLDRSNWAITDRDAFHGLSPRSAEDADSVEIASYKTNPRAAVSQLLFEMRKSKSVCYLAHQRQMVVFRIAEESHPEIVGSHVGNQQRLLNKLHSALGKSLRSLLDVVHFEIQN